MKNCDLGSGLKNVIFIAWCGEYTCIHLYMLFAGWEGCIVKNCDLGLENTALRLRLRAAFSRPRSQFFTIRTDPKLANIIITYLFFSCDKLAYNWVYETLLLNWLTCCLQTIAKKSNKRTREYITQTLDKEMYIVLKNRFISNCFIS